MKCQFSRLTQYVVWVSVTALQLLLPKTGIRYTALDNASGELPSWLISSLNPLHRAQVNRVVLKIALPWAETFLHLEYDLLSAEGRLLWVFWPLSQAIGEGLQNKKMENSRECFSNYSQIVGHNKLKLLTNLQLHLCSLTQAKL